MNEQSTIILFEPCIPPNTGNIVRTCHATNSNLILVNPQFKTDNTSLKRAGLDYWEGVKVSIIEDLIDFLKHTQQEFYFFSVKGTTNYTDTLFPRNAILIFGSETRGLPDIYHKTWPEKFLRIPMMPLNRCLNLSNCVSISIYELLRQHSYAF